VLVGVCLGRSTETIIALLAIWKAGGAYLPLDPDYPHERLEFMMADAKPKVVVSVTDTVAQQTRLTTGFTDCALVVLDDRATADTINKRSSETLLDTERLSPTTSKTLAYAIYTSGSTGRPKGVITTVLGIANLVQARARIVEGRTDLIMATFASASFDQSVEDVMLPLITGNTLLLCQLEDFVECEPNSRTVALDEVDFMHATPTALEALMRAGCRMSAKNTFVIGGEVVTKALQQAVTARDACLFASYGPTETTISVAMEKIGTESRTATLGRPMSNSEVYVVDERFEPVPVGVAGELVIGGVQVSRGYLGRASLTAEKFVPDPFSGVPGARLYRTGDLARWHANGTLEFCGRIDNQVKIRGMRVELGEIEAAIRALDLVAEAAVVASNDEETRLIAYLVPADEPEEALAGPRILGANSMDLEAVRHALKRTLAEHMVPSGFVVLSKMPVTASGKVDRKALPKAEISLARAAFEAPSGANEEAVAAAFAGVLSVEKVGRRDDFFDLGGHSLMAVRLVARLERATGKTLAIRTVFEAPTVAELAQALAVCPAAAAVSGIVQVPRGGVLGLSYQQERLWFLDQLDGAAGGAYHIEGVVRLSGPLAVPALEAALEELVARHESLRSHFGTDGEGRPILVVAPVGLRASLGHGQQDAGGPDAVPHADDLNPMSKPASAEPVLVQLDASGWSETSLRESVAARLAEPFDLASGPLFRALLLRRSDTEHLLVIGGHHAVLDGWSVGLLLKELSALYRAALTG
ncbi:MAG: amino acid adenylation domain-containing protein, partial [Pseudomonadota bacterium]